MFDYLQHPIVFTVICGLVGLCVGSFLNVVIHRLPKMLEAQWLRDAAEVRGESVVAGLSFNLATPGSRCPHCGHALGVLENIPLVSYVVLGGRCRHCGARISLRYPVVELVTAVLSVAVAWHFQFGWAALGGLLFVWMIVGLAFIDVETLLLPDDMTLPLLWLGLLFNLWATYVPLESAVAGAMVGYLALWAIYWLFRLVTGKEGMGHGDFKLLAAIGAWQGWQVLPTVVLLSSLVGAVVGIASIAAGRRGRETPIPFGPYLAAAGVLTLFCGDLLTSFFVPA